MQDGISKFLHIAFDNIFENDSSSYFGHCVFSLGTWILNIN